jgi:PAS domain S-box-containing protein
MRVIPGALCYPESGYDNHLKDKSMSKPLRVLIVEDSEDDAILLQHALRREGYKVICEVVDSPDSMRSVYTLLSEREALYRLLLQSMDSGFALHEVIYDAQGAPYDYRFLEINPTFEKLTGFKAEALLGHTVLEILPDTDKQWIEHYGRVALTGEVAHFENYARESGKYYEVTAYSPSRGQVAVVFHDITVRKQAEAALRENQLFIQRIADTIPNQLYVFDLVNKQNIYINQKTRDFFGLTLTEMQVRGQSLFFDLIHPDDRSKMNEFDHQWEFAEDSQVFEKVYRLRNAAGEYRWIRSNESILRRNPAGIPTQIVGMAEDITEQKQIVDALRENRAILQAAMDNSPAGIAIADAPDGKLRYVNEAGLLIRGGDRKTIVDGIGIDQYVTNWQLMDLDGTPLKPEEVPLARAILFGEANSREFIVRRGSDDDRIVLGNAAPILDEDGKVEAAIVVFSDITKSKQTEAEILKLNAELEQRVADRTAQLITANHELQAFSYSVSHDLRAPLRSIEGFSSILLEDYAGELDKQGKHYLVRIKENSQRMGQLINDLLNLSQVTTLAKFNRERVNLSLLATHIAAELIAESPQRRLEFDIAADLSVMGDENLLKIVLENLFNNACKFTIRCEIATIQFGMIERDGKQIYFVRDNGAGFDMTYANKLFAPFQRLHSNQEFPGTGIGLATVQRIINRHGGQVWAEGAVDKGATIYFTL